MKRCLILLALFGTIYPRGSSSGPDLSVGSLLSSDSSTCLFSQAKDIYDNVALPSQSIDLSDNRSSLWDSSDRYDRAERAGEYEQAISPYDLFGNDYRDECSYGSRIEAAQSNDLIIEFQCNITYECYEWQLPDDRQTPDDKPTQNPRSYERNEFERPERYYEQEVNVAALSAAARQAGQPHAYDHYTWNKFKEMFANDRDLKHYMRDYKKQERILDYDHYYTSTAFREFIQCLPFYNTLIFYKHLKLFQNNGAIVLRCLSLKNSSTIRCMALFMRSI